MVTQVMLQVSWGYKLRLCDKTRKLCLFAQGNFQLYDEPLV